MEITLDQKKWDTPCENGFKNGCLQRANHIALVQGCKLIVIGGYELGDRQNRLSSKRVEVLLGAKKITSELVNEKFRRAAHSVAIAFQDSNAILFGGLSDSYSLPYDTEIVKWNVLHSTNYELRIKDGRLKWSDPYRLNEKGEYHLILKMIKSRKEELECEDIKRITVEETFFDIQSLSNGSYCGYIETFCHGKAIRGPEFKFIAYGKVFGF